MSTKLLGRLNKSKFRLVGIETTSYLDYLINHSYVI